MGLITGLLTLPLAPVRGTVWLAERIQEQSEREYYSDERMREQLAAVDEARATGEIAPGEAALIEDELLERLMTARELGY